MLQSMGSQRVGQDLAIKQQQPHPGTGSRGDGGRSAPTPTPRGREAHTSLSSAFPGRSGYDPCVTPQVQAPLFLASLPVRSQIPVLPSAQEDQTFKRRKEGEGKKGS